MNIFITGTSSGIGFGLARKYLQRGAHVYGLSRTINTKLSTYANYHHLTQDLINTDEVQINLRVFLNPLEMLDLVVLNAGMLPVINDMKDTDLDDIRTVMKINVWANKVILDTLYETISDIQQVVAISSGASISGARGWNVYAISKAALNMLIRLYSREKPDTHYTALAPGIVNTNMQEYISKLPEDHRFPVVQKLKEMRAQNEMRDPSDAAENLIRGIMHVLQFESGSYVDIRDMFSDRGEKQGS